LLQLNKTVIIKEALANGRIFKMKSSAIIKSCMVFRSFKKYQVTDAVAPDMSWII
jgi:hypothetical protein